MNPFLDNDSYIKIERDGLIIVYYPEFIKKAKIKNLNDIYEYIKYFNVNLEGERIKFNLRNGNEFIKKCNISPIVIINFGIYRDINFYYNNRKSFSIQISENDLVFIHKLGEWQFDIPKRLRIESLSTIYYIY